MLWKCKKDNKDFVNNWRRRRQHNIYQEDITKQFLPHLHLFMLFANTYLFISSFYCKNSRGHTVCLLIAFFSIIFTNFIVSFLECFFFPCPSYKYKHFCRSFNFTSYQIFVDIVKGKAMRLWQWEAAAKAKILFWPSASSSSDGGLQRRQYHQCEGQMAD